MYLRNAKLLHPVGLLSLVSLILPIFAYAQVDSRALEEIIVTANKRSESLQDVPISIGVVGGELIEQYDIADLRDLQGFVPNLTVQRTFGNWAVRIRGLGSGVSNLAFDSSVGIFNDGVYCGRSRCLESAYMDVERVEVARGPQGALFGKSTIAGALSVHSGKPQDSLEGYVRAGLETEDGGYTAAMMITGPFTDNMRGRLAVETKDLDGWVSNPVGVDGEPKQESLSLRASLEFDINDNNALYFKIEHFNVDLIGRTNQLVGNGGLFGRLSQHEDKEFIRDTTRVVSTGVVREDFDSSKSTSFTLQYDGQFGGHTLTAIVNSWELNYSLFLDVDGVPELLLNTSLFENYDQQSLEVRLLSPAEQRLSYIFGALYHASDTTTRQYSPFNFGPFATQPQPVGGDRNFERDANTISLYGQLTFDIIDSLRIIFDARYTEEEQDGRGHSFPVIFPDGFTPMRVDSAFAQPQEYLFFQKRTDDSLDLSIKLQYELNDNISLYAGYSEGSKPGGLKANDANLGRQLFEAGKDVTVGPPRMVGPATDMSRTFWQAYVAQPTLAAGEDLTAAHLKAGVTLRQGNGVFDFEDEKAENIEVGVKALFADDAVSLSFAAFSTNFDNLQTSSYDGTQFIIRNAASAKVQGIEAESSWRINEHLRLNAALGIIDATYKDFPGAQCIVVNEAGDFRDPTCTDGNENLAGERLERSPNTEFNLSLDMHKPISSSLVLVGGFSVYHSGNYTVRQDFHPFGIQDSFQKFDLRVGLTNPADTWEVVLLARNLGDKRIIQHAYEIAGSNFVTESRGRSVMFEGTWRFR